MVKDSSAFRSFRILSEPVVQGCGSKRNVSAAILPETRWAFAKLPSPNKYKPEANKETFAEEMLPKKNIAVLVNLSEVLQALTSKAAIALPDMLRQLMALVQEWLKAGLKRAPTIQNHLI